MSSIPGAHAGEEDLSLQVALWPPYAVARLRVGKVGIGNNDAGHTQDSTTGTMGT